MKTKLVQDLKRHDLNPPCSRMTMIRGLMTASQPEQLEALSQNPPNQLRKVLSMIQLSATRVYIQDMTILSGGPDKWMMRKRKCNGRRPETAN